MPFWLPDMTDISGPTTIAVRRQLELLLAVYDHVEDQSELPMPEESSTSNSFIVGLDAHCGYTLRIELRSRSNRLESGYTLVEHGHDLHSPVFRAMRRVDGPWVLYGLNMDRASAEMRRLVDSLGLAVPSKRYETTDLAANIIFGKCCQMMLYGFMSR